MLLILLLWPLLLQSQPSPLELTPDWWKYFQVSPGELKGSVDKFLETISKTPPNLTFEGQEKAEDLIEKITVNLRALQTLSLQPAPVKTPIPPPKTFYTINDLVELSRMLQKETLELAAIQEQREISINNEKTLQERLDQLVVSYGNAESRSENKYLLGLEIMNFRTTFELEKKKAQSQSQMIDISKAHISQLKSQITIAGDRLISTQDELEQFDQLVSDATKQLEAAERKTREKVADVTTGFSKKPGQDAEIFNQYLTQELLSAEIQEAIATDHLLLAIVKKKLSELLQSPEEIDPDALQDNLALWQDQSKLFLEKLTKWNDSSQKALQRVGQVLSGTVEKKEEDSPLLQAIIQTSQDNLLAIEKLKSDNQDLQFLLNIVEKKIAGMRGITERWILFFFTWIQNVFEFLLESLGVTLFYVGQQPVSALGILRFFAIIVISYWLSRFVVKGLNQFAKSRQGVRRAVIYRINRLFQYLILTIGLIVALVFLGFDMSNLILLAGALGVGLGFGLQSIFNNFISGIIILFQSQLKVGDYIELESGLRGEIREINVRSTVLMTNDGLEVLIPNSELINTKVINWTLRDPYRRLRINFGVAYETDIDKMKEFIIEAAKKVPHTLMKIGIPEPVVHLVKFGESSIDFELFVWVNERSTRRMTRTKSAYLWAIHAALRKNGVQIPYPRRDLHFKEKSK